MSAYSNTTNKRMNLDKNVWWTMALTCIACLVLLGYSFVAKEKCTSFTIAAQGLKAEGNYVAGEPVFFRTSLTDGNEVTWSFGDSTEVQRTGSATIKHTFVKEGSFTVTAASKRLCPVAEIKIVVSKAERTGVKAPGIIGLPSLKEGQTGTYVSDVAGATAYEWKILDKSTFPTITDPSAKFTFPKAGLYHLQLTVDHDRNNKRAVMDINVVEAETKTAAPPPAVFIPPVIPQGGKKEESKETKSEEKDKPGEADKAPAKPAETTAKKNTIIGNKNFQRLLESVVAGQGDVESFDEYLHSKGNTTVHIVNEDAPKKFAQFINDIKGKGKKVSIEDVQLNKLPNDETVIISIDVKLKKKGFLGL